MTSAQLEICHEWKEMTPAVCKLWSLGSRRGMGGRGRGCLRPNLSIQRQEEETEIKAETGGGDEDKGVQGHPFSTFWYWASAMFTEPLLPSPVSSGEASRPQLVCVWAGARRLSALSCQREKERRQAAAEAMCDTVQGVRASGVEVTCPPRTEWIVRTNVDYECKNAWLVLFSILRQGLV